MKKHLLKVLLVISIITGFVTISNAQVTVTVRPTVPVIVRPMTPSPQHIWIDGEWVLRGGRYEYASGYWIVPKHAGARWIPGHWKNSRRGWVWKPGHWRR